MKKSIKKLISIIAATLCFTSLFFVTACGGGSGNSGGNGSNESAAPSTGKTLKSKRFNSVTELNGSTQSRKSGKIRPATKLLLRPPSERAVTTVSRTRYNLTRPIRIFSFTEQQITPRGYTRVKSKRAGRRIPTCLWI